LAQPLKIFISSPGDVGEERRRAAIVISRLRREFARFFDLSAVLWEYEPMLSSGHFQDIIEPPSTADIVVLILWSRLGTPLPERTATRAYTGRDGRFPVTGTEWEFEEALEARERRGGVPDLLVYRKFAAGEAWFNHSDQLELIRQQWDAMQAFWQRHFEADDGTFKAAFNRFVTLDEFEAQLESHLRELLRRRLPPGPLRITRVQERDRIEWWSGSPYRGLQVFDQQHAAVFFGRERAEREITEALVRHAGEGAAFMLVLGASGSGKSSLVRAGLLPDLVAPGVVAGTSVWRKAIVDPSQLLPDVFTGLAAALMREHALPELATVGYTEAEVAAQLRAGAALPLVPLRLALERAAAADQHASAEGVKRGRLILVIDQLEVLFTAAGFDDAARRSFDSLMAQFARSGFVWVIVTLRSDFYHRLAELPELNALANGAGIYQLAAPTDAELEQIISRPAEVAGLAFEIQQDTGISLASVIRQDAARDPASLPLLSFVLDELYRRDVAAADGTVLTYHSYNDMGGLAGAIAHHADALLQSLPAEIAAALPALLLTLVEVDELKGTVTARTVRQETLTDPLQLELANRLVAARLAVADDTGQGVTLRLAHEALLANWPKLASLIGDHRDFLIVRRRLQEEAAAWQRHDRHPDFLLPPGRRLAEAEDVWSRRRDELDPEIVAYAEASMEAERERVAAVQRAKEEALRRELARSRRFAAVVSVFLALAVAGGIFAWHERGVATGALDQAEKNYQLALNQSVGDLQLLEENYDDGNLSTEILRSLVQRAQATVSRLSDAGDTEEVTAARTQLLDIVALMEVSIGDSKAVGTAQDEVALSERLMAKDPNNPRWLRLFAMAKGELSDVLFWQCDCIAAAEQARQAAVVAKQLLVSTPDDYFLHERLLTDYETRGDALRMMGDLDGADEAFATELKDLQAALAREPGDKRWLADEAFTIERIGDELLLKGHAAEAAVQFQIDFSIASDLVNRNLQHVNYLSALVQSHQRLGDAWMAQNDTVQAMTEYKQYLMLAARLSNSDPANFRFRDFYATAHQRIGDLHLVEKDHEAATSEFTTYLDMAQELLARSRSNNTALYDVANAFSKLGDVKFAQGDFAAALDYYRHAEAVALELAGKNCQNGAWQRMVALSHQRVGETLKAQRDFGGARNEFLQCAAIPVKPTVWSPAALLPKDVKSYCENEVAQLDAR
jgi:tetratricopeptide (TPR) repeat protein